MIMSLSFRIAPALLLGGLLALAVPAPVFAHGEAPDPTAEAAPGISTEERLRLLEERQAELYHTLAEKKDAGLASRITERITVSGLVEVEAAAAGRKFADGSTDGASDLALATVQLALGVRLTEAVRGDISLLYEEGAFGAEDTDLQVDEAAIRFASGPWSARVGRQYLPFGVFHSHFISDPLTLELGETRETAALAGYTFGPATLAAFAFNGDAEKSGEEDHLRDWGASLVIAPTPGFELGGSYLSDLADSDADLASDYQRRVGGWSAFAFFEQGEFGASAEFLGAVKSFAAADLDADGNGTGDRPLAWNFEAFWAPVEQLELAARYEGSSEFAGRPQRQYGVDLSWSIWDYTTLSLEYLRGEFDHEFNLDADGKTLDRRDLVTAQLAFEF